MKTIRTILILVLLSTGIAATGYCEAGRDFPPQVVVGKETDYLVVPASGKVYASQRRANGSVYFVEALVLGYDDASEEAEALKIEHQSKNAAKSRLTLVKPGR